MKGVIVKTAGAAFEVVTDIEKPKPGVDQILVKSIATAINPVETFMIQGMLVSSFPIVLGCDSSGIVVEAGKEAKSLFKVGDRVCGCTRLGEPGYGTFQEYFLMDAKLAIPIPKKVSHQLGAAIGVGTETASLGVFRGLGIKLPDPKALPEVKDEWVVILGGAGSVGQYAVQLAKLSGYKVVATCSQKTAPLVQSLGADAVIDYRKSEDEQLQDLKAITGGNFFGVFDSVAKSIGWSLKALKDLSTANNKHFTTTDDWSPEVSESNISIYRIALGLIGKSGDALAHDPTLNDDIASYIPVIHQLIEDGKLRVNGINVVEKGGFEGVADAYAFQQKNQGAGKIVITLQEE